MEPPFAFKVTYCRRKTGLWQANVAVEGHGRRAKVARSDFERFKERFGERPWTVQVIKRVKTLMFETDCPGIFMPVANALLDIEGHLEVKPRDRKFLNMLPDNLEVVGPGGA